MSDPQHKVQEDLGEREHHERLEQLQLGDENVADSVRRSKESAGTEREPLSPKILEAPDTSSEG